jgi:hypothetical protein
MVDYFLRVVNGFICFFSLHKMPNLAWDKSGYIRVWEVNIQKNKLDIFDPNRKEWGGMRAKNITLACFFILLMSFSLSATAGGGGRIQYDLGVFALNEGDFVAAEKYFTDAIQQEQDNPHYHHYLGNTYLKTARPWVIIN